jgi:hypothetical protein
LAYRVEVFDKNLKRVGEIDEWISLDFTVRFCQVGMWQLLIKDGTPQSDLIEKGGGIVIWQDDASEPLLSGQVDTYQKYWTTQQHTGSGSLYIAGQCHNRLAYSRIAYPDSSWNVVSQYKAPRARTVALPAGRLIWSELYQAIGSGAITSRRIPQLVMGTMPTTMGTRVTDTVRYDNLGTKFETWTEDKSVGYRLLYNANTQTVDLNMYVPRDRTKDVRFSTDLGNLREYIYTLNAPQVTRAIIACGGEGKYRYIYEKVDTAAEAEWGLSIERLVDRRDIPLKTDSKGKVALVTTEMENGWEDIGLNPEGGEWTAALAAAKKKYEDAVAAGDPDTDPEYDAVVAEIAKAKPVAVAHYLEVAEAAAVASLAEGEKRGNFQIYPIDTPDCQFGVHYFVGDLVTVAVDGVEYSDIVREVVISVDDGGNVQDVKPKIGQQGSGEPLNLYKTVYEMQRKLNRLESRM